MTEDEAGSGVLLPDAQIPETWHGVVSLCGFPYAVTAQRSVGRDGAVLGVRLSFTVAPRAIHK